LRHLAYIEAIKSLKPIPGADNIECATILGFECVVKKGDFSVGDLCVYVEIDSILPEWAPFEFLRSRKFRVKTIKLRGQISQGLAFPIFLLKEVDFSIDLKKLSVGTDLTETLKIVKYDPEALLDDDIDTTESNVKKSWLEKKYSYYKWKLLGVKPIKKGSFPNDVPKTDETRVQKMGGLLEEMAGAPVYISEKCEGTSATFVYRTTGNWLAKLFGQDGVFQVCSRNRIIYNSQKSDEMVAHHLCTVATKYNIAAGLKKLGRNIALQAECIGPKIQGNIYRIPELELRLFSVFDIDKQVYVGYSELMEVATALNIPTVPIVDDNATLVNSIPYYVTLSKGKSLNNQKIEREGIVIRAKDSCFSFKSINPEYLLKQE
jgi:hypothetical protein